MPATIYYDNDADLSVLKDKTIAILGYGSQGHAQAQNLRDSGCNVIIGQRPGSANYDLAVGHGFKPVTLEEATKQADIINVLLPDEVQGDLYKSAIRPNLVEGNVLMCSH
ncbi:MAG: ketol-acid reductoisomerase, partial [Pirellulaceae bacterium]